MQLLKQPHVVDFRRVLGTIMGIPQTNEMLVPKIAETVGCNPEKSRRRIASPKARDKAPYQVDLAMSAKGQKQMRCNRPCPLYSNSDRESGFPQQAMSALPPKADIRRSDLMR